jgi:toxin FitB
MYLLDTHILSELRKRQRTNPNVAAWLATVQPTHLYLSTMTIMEIEIGTRRLLRRDPAQGGDLRRWIDAKVLPAFAGRILDFDTITAQRCADLHVPNLASGRDLIIAATALVHGLTVVTRNVADFAATGVPLLNPFK